MSGQTNQDGIEVTPSVGFGSIRLGESVDDVRAALQSLGFAFDDELDPYAWEISAPYCTLVFQKGKPDRLVQIQLSSEHFTLGGKPLVDLPLDEALSTLGVRSFDDTLWSMVDCDFEYNDGVPIEDSKRPQKSDPESLLDSGTLWIKSLGIGLSLFESRVETILMRKIGEEPKIGCGPLTHETILSVPEFEDRLPPPQKTWNASSSKGTAYSRHRIVQGILLLVAIALMVVPAYSLYDRYDRWNHAPQVMGTIIEARPEGPFPEELVVQYELPGGKVETTVVRSVHVNAREVGETVELRYLSENPTYALPSSMARIEFTSGYLPYLAICSPLVAGLILMYAFPRWPQGRNRQS